MKSKHRTPNGCQKKIVLGRPKENEARKAFRKVIKAFGKVVFVFTHQKKVQAMISNRTKAEAKTKKEMAKKVLIFNLDFRPLKHPVKKDIAVPGNQTIGIPSQLTIHQLQLLHGMARDILHGWHQSL